MLEGSRQPVGSWRCGERREMVRTAKKILLNEETEPTPISDRMKALRGDDLTKSQVAIISKFISASVSKKDAKSYKSAYRTINVLDVERSKLDKATPKVQNTIKKHIHRLDTRLIHAKKRNRLDRCRPIVAIILEYIRKNGAPKNMRELYKSLREGDDLTRFNKYGKPHKLSETTVRDILHDRFGIKGKPGRKPR
jgi:hypothetical protein